MEAVYTVYKTTNLVNGKIYIGVHKTRNPQDNYLGSGIHITEALQKYGKENFMKEILFIFSTPDGAYQKEKELVNKEFVDRADTYNIATGGSVSPDWAEERKFYFREWLQGENHPMYGKKMSQESSEKKSKALTGKKRSQEAKDKAAETRKNNKIPSCWKGKNQPEEANRKRSESHKNLEKVTCPHCNKTVSPQNASRWHFDNCKAKT